MKENIKEERLYDLLSEWESQASFSSQHLLAALEEQKRIALFGAGMVGRKVARTLSEFGISNIYFIDETPSKHHTQLDGYMIYPLDEAIELVGKSGLVICSIYSANSSLCQLTSRLSDLFEAPVITFLAVAKQFPEKLLPFYGLHQPAAIFHNCPQYTWLHGRLSDPASQNVLLSHLRYNMMLEPCNVPSISPSFEVIKEHIDKHTVFVDCGAFDGDTVAAFIKLTDGHFEKIIAYEPDPRNRAALNLKIEKLPPGLSDRIETYPFGIWSETTELSFESTGTQASNISTTGSIPVQVIALDNVLEKGKKYFIKFDIEGAEPQGIAGAANIIREESVILGISVYHEPDHLWQIAQQLETMRPGMHFLLRCHGENGSDLMLYAIA